MNKNDLVRDGSLDYLSKKQKKEEVKFLKNVWIPILQTKLDEATKRLEVITASKRS